MGFPSKGTKADKRLKTNNPAAGKKMPAKKMPAFGGKKAPPFPKK